MACEMFCFASQLSAHVQMIQLCLVWTSSTPALAVYCSQMYVILINIEVHDYVIQAIMHHA